MEADDHPSPKEDGIIFGIFSHRGKQMGGRAGKMSNDAFCCLKRRKQIGEEGSAERWHADAECLADSVMHGRRAVKGAGREKGACDAETGSIIIPRDCVCDQSGRYHFRSVFRHGNDGRGGEKTRAEFYRD